MRAIQISVFLENKAGRLSEVTSVLAEAGVNIRALTVADTTDFGVLRMIVSDIDKAEEALRSYGYSVGRTDVLAVEVEDRPGGLNRILQILTNENINVEYMYAFVHKGSEAIMIFRFDDVELATNVLAREGINVINGADVYQM